jgi:uncharacterized RDD family membrane protein YckC
MTAHIAHIEPERDVGLQGCYAGFATRLVAFAFDIAALLTLFALASQTFDYVLSAVSGTTVDLRDAAPVGGIVLVVWWFVYSAYPLAQGGRTLGMAIVGLRAVRADGSDLDAGHAVVRVLFFPLSLILFVIAFGMLLVRRDRRALHDLIARTAVVYAWDARAARLRFLATRDPV